MTKIQPNSIEEEVKISFNGLDADKGIILVWKLGN